MKKQVNLLMYALCVCFLMSATMSFAQTAANDDAAKEAFKPSGKAHGKIYFNAHYDLTKDVNKVTAFEIKRTYFGYKYNFSKKLKTKITFDVGSNSGGSALTAYLKIASLEWQAAKSLKLSAGMIGLKQFNDQEKFWGYRYLYKSAQDQHKFSSSADMGISANVKLHKNAQINLLVFNGEGYKASQDAFGCYRIGGNVILTPVEGLTIKGYFDSNPKKFAAKNTEGDDMVKDTVTQTSVVTFIGYKFKKKARLGVEYNMQTNNKNAEDNNLSLISVYATAAVSKKVEVFARYDMLASSGNEVEVVAGDPLENWNYKKDGSAMIVGAQYAAVKGVKVALNYQGWSYTYSELDPKPKVYLNLEYKF